MNAQGEDISSRERNDCRHNDTFAAHLGVASPDAEWATFFPVLAMDTNTPRKWDDATKGSGRACIQQNRRR
ncbi:hypothetical protein E4U40_007455 [Claviceps sp. LM458 group G5]|nr:hypothetical protein E4U40_007455 [Claviceps sp. LM458 group G5]